MKRDLILARATPRVAEPHLVQIPAGTFRMGHDLGQDCERPVHRVWVDRVFLAAAPVSNTEYGCFVQETGAPEPPFWRDEGFADPQQPVVGVSWFDATSYCEWLSRATGRDFRLPTEAEWEHAARGGMEGCMYPWGDQPPQTRPDYAERWQRGPEPVGTGYRNAFGLYDMCENVHEWCLDWYEAEFYAHSPERNPRGPEQGTRRASRGGSWRHHVKISGCHTRSSIPPEFRYADYGFRIAAGM